MNTSEIICQLVNSLPALKEKDRELVWGVINQHRDILSKEKDTTEMEKSVLDLSARVQELESSVSFLKAGK